MMSGRLFAPLLLIGAMSFWMPASVAFSPVASCSSGQQQQQSRPNSAAIIARATPEESANALTDFMAKSHEDKLRALAETEAKFKARIEELESQLAACKSGKLEASSGDQPQSTTTPSTPTGESKNSYEFPATNKALAEKVSAYQRFISEYIVQAQIEKRKAVAEAEKKIREHYESRMTK